MHSILKRMKKTIKKEKLVCSKQNPQMRKIKSTNTNIQIAWQECCNSSRKKERIVKLALRGKKEIEEDISDISNALIVVGL